MMVWAALKPHAKKKTFSPSDVLDLSLFEEQDDLTEEDKKRLEKERKATLDRSHNLTDKYRSLIDNFDKLATY